MTRRSALLAFGFVAVVSLPAGVHAQIQPGVHVAHATDTFDGVTGVGGSLLLSLPALPIDLFFAGEYFFPSCDNCSFWGGSADIHFSLPVPVFTPYGTAGVVLRNTDASDTSVRTGGLGLGAGADLSTFVVGAYVEGRYELMDGSVDQLVFRLGVRF